MAKNNHLKRKPTNGAISHEVVETATRTQVKAILAQAGATILLDDFDFDAREAIKWMGLAMLTPEPTTVNDAGKLIEHYLLAWGYILKYSFDWDNKSKREGDEVLDAIPRWMAKALDATTAMLQARTEETKKLQERLGELREQVGAALEGVESD